MTGNDRVKNFGRRGLQVTARRTRMERPNFSLVKSTNYEHRKNVVRLIHESISKSIVLGTVFFNPKVEPVKSSWRAAVMNERFHDISDLRSG